MRIQELCFANTIMININMRCIEMPLLAVMLVGGTGLTLT